MQERGAAYIFLPWSKSIARAPRRQVESMLTIWRMSECEPATSWSITLPSHLMPSLHSRGEVR